jgi:hypothetical protein
MGSELGLTTGQAFDAQIQPVIEGRERITAEEWRTTARYRIVGPDGEVTTAEREDLRETVFWQTRMRYTLTNARPQPVTVSVFQTGLDNYWHDTRIVSESVQSERLSSDEVVWQVTVPANGRTDLNVTFQSRH